MRFVPTAAKQKPVEVTRPSLGHSADLGVTRRSLATGQARSSFLDLGRSTFAIIRSPQLVSASALFFAACAGARPGPTSLTPERLVLVVASSVGRLPPQTVLGQLVGGEGLADVLARDAAEALRARGFGIAATRVGPEEADALTAGASELAASNGARGALVLVLTRMDLSALRTRGRAEIDLRAQLVSADGHPLWTEARTVRTSVRLYRSDSDWRSHLREAATEVVKDLP